jgi:hypothetical protein
VNAVGAITRIDNCFIVEGKDGERFLAYAEYESGDAYLVRLEDNRTGPFRGGVAHAVAHAGLALVEGQ